MAFRVGFDVGGTFTDFALQTEDGRLLTGKRLTTPDDPARACVEGLRELVARAGLGWAELAQAVHGTTLGSNVVIERKGGHVALLTTRGFRDVLIIGREKRYQLYDLLIEKPAPLVPRSRIREVTERMAFDGEVLVPLDEAGLRRTVRRSAGTGWSRSPSASCMPTPIRARAARRRDRPRGAAARPGQPVLRDLARDPRVRADVDDRRQRVRDDRGPRLPPTPRGGARDARLPRPLFVMQSGGGIATAGRWPDSPCA